MMTLAPPPEPPVEEVEDPFERACPVCNKKRKVRAILLRRHFSFKCPECGLIFARPWWGEEVE